MNVFDVISLFGGLAMFLYGMRLMGNSLKEGSSGTLKKAMERVTNSAWKAFFLGLGVTAIIQSSTATIVITSGLVGAGILSLHQSLGIIIGANVGTTITGQIIRLLDVDSSATAWLSIFKPSTLAPAALIIAIIILMSNGFGGKVKDSDIYGNILMGFGILFSGLLSMTSAVDNLSATGIFDRMFSSLSTNPLLGYLLGVLVSFILQSSSATVGILQAISVSGALSFASVYPVIIGIYLGDCVTTAIVCSIGAKADPKRVGIVHILFNLGETVLVFAGVFIAHRTGWLSGIWSTPITSGGIANMNTIFKLSTAVILFPCLNLFEKMSIKIVKDDKEKEWKYQTLVDGLNPQFFNTPALAFRSVNEALRTMLELSHASIDKALVMLTEFDDDVYQQISDDEDSIDRLCDRVSHYLVQMSPHLMTDGNIRIFNEYTQACTEFERLGDHAMNVAQYARTLHKNEYQLSAAGKAELKVMTDAINEVLDTTTDVFEKKDLQAARSVEPIEEVIDDLGDAMKENHLKRLRSGKCNVYTGAVFLDLLIDLERISDCCSNIAIAMVERVSNTTVHAHEYAEELHQGNDEYFNTMYNKYHESYMGQLEAASKVEGD